jgi:hypothetical protein
MSRDHIAKSMNPFEEGWIEEGLFYRGEKPPLGKHWKEDDWVYLPHENYIPISKSRVLSVIKKEVAGQHNDLHVQHFVQLLEGIYHFHYHKTLNELKEDYEYFAPATGDYMRKNIVQEEVNFREKRFLVNFLQLMVRGNFNPLTHAEHKHAEKHNYLLDLPIDINWSIQDPAMIRNLLAYSQDDEGKAFIHEKVGVDHLDQFLQLPKAFDNRALVFHRGIEPDQVQGTFLLQKVNRIIDKIFDIIFAPLRKGVEKVSDQGETIISSAVDLGKDAVQGVVHRGKSVLAGRPFAPRTKTTTDNHDPLNMNRDDVVFLPRWLRRTSLQNQPLSLTGLFKTTLLQEPAMERVICIFRLFPPSPPPILKKLPLVGRFIKSPEPNAVDNTIHIKLFQKIPLADLELIFPEKRIRMKSFDKFMLGFLGMIGLVVGVVKGMSSGKNALIVIFSVLGLLAFKTIMRFINTRRRYMLQMSQDLYHKNLDNDIGVLQYLVDNIEDQEFKESLIAYMLLLKAGKPMSESELDSEAERLLNNHFDGLEVDFEVDDALEKITVKVDANGQEVLSEDQKNSTMFLPIVTAQTQVDGTVMYQAKSLPVALQVMDEKWDNFFQYS